MPNSGARKDPFPSFRFTITFDDLPPGGFSDCSGLQMETEVHDYAEGGLNTHYSEPRGSLGDTYLSARPELTTKLSRDLLKMFAVQPRGPLLGEAIGH